MEELGRLVGRGDTGLLAERRGADPVLTAHELLLVL